MNNGADLESYVHDIYSILLNLKDEGVTVTKNAKLKGRGGVEHQIDIYYEFARAGITHRVAIECKDLGRPVDKDRVQSFVFKVGDLGDVKGVMVSSSGYQSGAQEIARHYNILLLNTSQLPALSRVLGERLGAVALPDESYVGEPFWTIMEVHDGKVTGSYLAQYVSCVNKPCIPLFYSKYHAECAMLQGGLSKQQWGVRGLPRYSLRAFILMLELFEIRENGAAICIREPGASDAEKFFATPITREQLIKEYYGGEISSIKEYRLKNNPTVAESV